MYEVRDGDTFEIISRRSYGVGDYASLIQRANPGAQEPLTPGTTLAIPKVPGAPKNRLSKSVSQRENEASLLIDGERFRFWSDVTITRSIDQMDTLEFSCPFDSTAPGFRETFKPFSYKPLQLNIGGVPIFTGTMMVPKPVLEKDGKTLQVSAYSTPGVLNDCTAPASMFSGGENGLEFNNQNLRDIAIALASPFGISTAFLDDPGAAFERVSIKPQTKILGFLATLAKQRNMVISSTETGDLLFQRSVDSDIPVAQLSQGNSPVQSVEPFFSPQEYYSHITGIQPVSIGTNGSQHTVRNPHLPGVIRPFTFETPDVTEGDTPTATNSKAGRMYGNACSYAVGLSTWRDDYGDLWTPNTIVSLVAPDAMIYANYNFLIRSVAFKRDRNNESSVLNLTLPGAFNGKTPESLPWD